MNENETYDKSMMAEEPTLSTYGVKSIQVGSNLPELTHDLHLYNPSVHSQEETDARIDDAEAEFERGEWMTHEQMMAEIKQEFPWLL